MKNLKNPTTIEVRNERNNVVADTFGVSDLVTNIYQAQIEYAEKTYRFLGVDSIKIRKQYERDLQTLRDLCAKNKINLVAQQRYFSSHKYDECIAYIIYSVERDTLFTVSRSTAEWYTPEEFLEQYDYNNVVEDYFIDSEVGVGHYDKEDDIVSVHNFGAINCIPGALFDFLTDRILIQSHLEDYVDDERADIE
jgi:hypothetical protein